MLSIVLSATRFRDKMDDFNMVFPYFSLHSLLMSKITSYLIKVFTFHHSGKSVIVVYYIF